MCQFHSVDAHEGALRWPSHRNVYREVGILACSTRWSAGVQALPARFFEQKFNAVQHDLCELSQLADQAHMEALAESRIAALEVGCHSCFCIL